MTSAGGGYQFAQEARQANGFGAQAGANEGFPTSGSIAFVEDEVDRGEHGVEPLGHLVAAGDDVGDAGVANFAFGAHQALGHGWRGHEKGARDLIGFEAAEGAQGERHLGVESQGGVATGEDQPQPFVGNFTGIVVRRDRASLRGIGQRLDARLAAEMVDRFMTRRLEDPGARLFGHAGGRPLMEGGGKRLLGGVLGDIEITHHADQRGDDAAPIGPVERINGGEGIHAAFFR